MLRLVFERDGYRCTSCDRARKLDRGKDRICVRLKSGDGVTNHYVLLRLIGSVSNSQAQTARLVSIGEVNATAQKNMDNSFFKPRVW